MVMMLFWFFNCEDLDPAQASAQLIAKQVSLKLPKGANPKLAKVFEACMKWDPKQRYDFAKICKIFGEKE